MLPRKPARVAALSILALRLGVASPAIHFEPAEKDASQSLFTALTGSGVVEFNHRGVVLPDSVELRFACPFAVLRPEPESPLAGRSHYLVEGGAESGRRNVGHYGKLRYRNVCPGIDAVFYASEGGLEFDFIVQPGADPSAIALKFPGSVSKRLTLQGDLLIRSAADEIRQRRPVAYQDANGRREYVSAGYIIGTSSVQFVVGSYDKTRPLIIDPVIEFSSILGTGYPTDIAYGDDGSIYIVGSANPEEFPTTTSRVGTGSSFLTKLDPTGSDIIYSTFFDQDTNVYAVAVTSDGSAVVAGSAGGDGFVEKLSSDGSAIEFKTSLGIGAAHALEIDDRGDIYAAGFTTQASSFPATARFLNDTRAGLRGAALIRSDDRGETWRRSDDGLPAVRVVKIEPAPNLPNLLYAATSVGLFRSQDGGASWTLSFSRRAGVPTAYGVWASPAEPGIAYVLLAAGALYRTTDEGRTWFELPRQQWRPSALAVDPATPGKVFAASRDGVYRSEDGAETWTGTILAPDPAQGLIDRLWVPPADPHIVYAGSSSGGVLWKSADGGDTWTHIGESAIPSVAVLCGDPSSADIIFAGSSDDEAALRKSEDGGLTWHPSDSGISADLGIRHCIVSPEDPDLVVATGETLYLSNDGGRSWRLASERLRGLSLGGAALDPFDANRIWVGMTSVDDGPYSDAFAAKIAGDGSGVLYSVLFGGADDDVAHGIAVRSDHQLVVTGRTNSIDFPVKKALQPELADVGPSADGFVLQLDETGDSIVRSTYWGGRSDDGAGGVAVDMEDRIYIAGWTYSTDFPLVSPMQDTLQPGRDLFVTRFDLDVGRAEYSTFLGGAGYEEFGGFAVDALGRAYLSGYANGPDFAVTDRPFVPCVGNPTDSRDSAFVFRLSAQGDRFERSILFGGELDDRASAMAFRAPFGVAVAGWTKSSDFVTGPRGYLGAQRSGHDVFVTAFDLDAPAADRSFSVDCIANAASLRSTAIAPGEIVTLFGAGLGPAQPIAFQLDDEGRAPRSLGGTRVLFDGVEAPLLFVSDAQINAIVPQAVSGREETSIAVERLGERTRAVRRRAAPTSPAIFVDSQSGFALALNDDGKINGSNPADAGSVISLFATGLGLPDQPLPDGAVNPLDAKPTDSSVTATIAGLPAEVRYAGPAPGLVQGVWQVNVRIPSALASESLVRIYAGEAETPDARINIRYQRP